VKQQVNSQVEHVRPSICARWDGFVLTALFNAGSLEVKNHMEALNSIDVFPTPSGWAGTAIYLTLQAGCEAINQRPRSSASEVAHAFAHASLMGARGHQGIPFPQWFRGFARGLDEGSAVNATNLADAMVEAADTAHRTYIKPIEGEMWTVAKEAAEEAQRTTIETKNICHILQASTIRAKRSVARTPQLISLLQQLGAVHAGGLAFFLFLNGMCKYLGEEFATHPLEITPEAEVAELIKRFNSVLDDEIAEN